MKLRLTIRVLVTVVFISVTHAQSTTPDATVRAFYAYSNARSATFNRRHIELRKKWYTPALYAAFLKQLEEDQAHARAHLDEKPFFGDGLDFRPLDEPCRVGERSYRRTQRVARTQMTGNRAEVDVKFAYPPACTEGYQPIVITVNLQKVGGTWLINDWTYEDGSTLVHDMNEHKY